MSGKPRKVSGRVVPLRSQEAGEPPCPPTVEERMSLVSRLSREAWELSGRPYPNYTRATMPVRITTLSEQDAD